jgi:cell division protein FtsN
MRHLRADVSHRIRHRGPSIFTAWWLRACLGVGFAVIVGLVVGPSVAGRFGADLPRTVLRLSPWDAAERPSDGISAVRDGASASGDASGIGAPSRPEGPGPGGVAWPGRSAAANPGPSSASVAGVPGSTSGAPSVSRAPAAPPAPSAKVSSAAGPPLYWIQVGAFLDHRNADRLVERLRGEGLSAATVVLEQSRILYRVLVAPSEGTSVVPEAVLDKVRTLGFTVEPTDAGPAATGVVPLQTAVEASHRLRAQGVPVRLKQEIGSAAFRVVRVGAYETSRQAEETLAALQAKGVEGFVVRDR